MSISGSAETYYVSPTANTPCTSEGHSCLTLSDYITRIGKHLDSNRSTTMILLPGNHSLETNFVVRNLTNFTLIGHNSSTQVMCNEQTIAGTGISITLTMVNFVHIKDLTFIGCKRLRVIRVNNFLMETSKIIGRDNNRGGIVLNQIYQAMVVNCTFHSNFAVKQNNSSSALDYTLLSGGGLAVLESNLTITGCTLKNNKAESFGGGLYAWRSTTLIINATFDANMADIGGGICNIHGTLILMECTFSNNSADSWGGGLYTALSTISIVTNSFTQCRAEDGALIVAIESKITTTNSQITNNTSNMSIITFIHSSSLSISNCYFANNTAGINALSFENSTLTIQGGTFESNVGGIISASVDGTKESTVNIIDSTFTGNTAGHLYSNGCVVNAEIVALTVEITNCTFNGNTCWGKNSTLSGGVIAVSGFYSPTNSSKTTTAVQHTGRPQIHVNNSKFTNNHANYGGAMAVYSGEVLVNNCVFYNNTADVGGAISVIQGEGQVVKFSSLRTNYTYNTAGRGGAIYADSLSTVVTIRIDDNLFSYNYADIEGGAFFLSTTNMLIDRSTLIYNSVLQHDYHGIVYVEESTIISTGSLILEWNIGGFTFYSSNVSISGVTKIANNNQGCIIAVSSSLTIQGSVSFTSNSAPFIADMHHSRNTTSFLVIGGAITSIQSQVTLRDSCQFITNTANIGAAILAIESKILIEGEMTFNSNTALTSGGAIYAFHSEINFGGKIKISNNTALDSGGGIYVVASTLRLLSGHLNVERNIAKYGGGVCLKTNSKVYIVKTKSECLGDLMLYNCIRNKDNWLKLMLLDNVAEYGGGFILKMVTQRCVEMNLTSQLRSVPSRYCSSHFQASYCINTMTN